MKINNDLERELCDINAEAAILSAMLMDKWAIARVIESVNENYFYNKSHKVIFSSIKKLFLNNVDVDLVTVADSLKNSGELKSAGGLPYLSEIADIVASSASIDAHLSILIENYLRREIRITLKSSMAKIEEGKMASDVYAYTSERLSNIFAKTSSGLTKVGEFIPDFFRKLESTEFVNMLCLGFPSVDRIIGGIGEGKLIMLAARPSMGKSTLAINCACNMVSSNKKVAFLSIEMTTDEILTTILSSGSGVERSHIKNMTLGKSQIEPITEFVETIHESELYIDDNPGTTIEAIEMKIRKAYYELGIKTFFIDHLQLVYSEKRSESRSLEIGRITGRLKRLAKEIKGQIFLLSQLNRDVENRTNKEPQLSDLRASGAIEQDADIIMLIYRLDYYETDVFKHNGQADIIIAKNRGGRTGRAFLEFIPNITKFDNIEHPIKQIDF